jgi:polysaccharide biosynthesis transport protein
MHNPLNRYALIAKRWAWLIILGVVICGSAVYIISKFVPPTYQASSTLILNECTVQSSVYDCTTAGLEALSTYSQLITSPVVLNPVVQQHPGMAFQQLTALVSVKPQSNTLLIEIDVKNTDPQLAAQLANQVAQSFAQFSNAQLPGNVQVITATVPIDPTGLKATYAAGLGALVGLGLALALILLFEWIDDHLSGPDELQDLLGVDALTIIPQLTSKQLRLKASRTPEFAEGCRILCTGLNAAQSIKPFKLIMITSALADEGKSLIAANLATFMAQSGKRVLLVDADLRNYGLNQYFPPDEQHTLSYAFLGAWAQVNNDLEGQPTEIPTLQVLSAGIAPANPAELLQSPAAERIFQNLRNSSRYDYIIFDTPPLLPIADAQVLGSYMQATLLVVDASKTSRKALTRARQALKRTHTTLLGAIINKSPWSDFGDVHQYLDEIYRQKKIDISHFQAPITPIPTPILHHLGETGIEETVKTLILPSIRDKSE